ncbi:disease resistance protein RPM1-like [Punica granatum]|uniref:Uncharacterized protein n=2 Tax=Punica granatum TaxID=22663 RepID=A0A218W797_PUNGR|nr:disease resistance protein RPM1-like [Punica granatum]OWM68506.1 hypothetical protein CDL15_Pgr023471 [Punica granatum]PKI59581.1 hypothetical protein CRG98_019990 [Punica granatum]
MAEAAVNHLLGRIDNIIEEKFAPFTDVREEITSSRQELDHVKAFLRVADVEEENDDEVKTWVKHLRDAAYEFEDVLDEYKLLMLHEPGEGYLRFAHRWVNNFKARSRIMPNLRRLCMKIRSICERHQRLSHKFSQNGERVSTIRADSTWQDHQSDALLLDTVDLVGIEERKSHLMQWLLGGLSGTGAMAVHGMGGLGKTTLVRQVYEDPEVKKHFEVRAWVTLSPSFDTKDLLKDMFRQLSSEPRRKAPRREGVASINFLKISIKNLLLKGRFLVILDDVWHADRWETVKYLFPNNDCGSRVMLTTRHVEIAAAACKHLVGEAYNLMPLSNEESWKLFCRKTFQGNPCPPHLKDICTDILKKCEGLPLPIVAISGVLATKGTHRKDEWDLVLRSLRSLDGNDRLKKINKVLSHSFNDLPYYLRSCFLHLSVFPEGHVIESARLIRLWVEERFIEVKAGMTMEEVAEDYLNELLSRNLMQVAETTSDGRIKRCRIHHLLRDMAISKSEEQSFAVAVDEQNPLWPEKVRHLSMHGIFQHLPEQRSISHLRSLFTFGVDKSSIKAALSHLKLLAVLDLQYSPLNKFPIQVVDMYFLRYLSLRYTHVQTIPRLIGKLEYLEVLDLKHTNVIELPVEIMKLRRLRHLLVYRYELESYVHTKYGFKTLAGIGALQSLQKLCYIEADDERSRIMVQELGNLTQLRRLCILKLKEEDGAALCSSITKLTNLRALSVSSLKEDDVLDMQHLCFLPPLLQRIYLTGHLEALPRWLCSMNTLIALHLKWSQLKDDPLPSLQRLPNLVHLELLKVYDWEVLHFEGKGFRKLKKLGLDLFDRLTCIEVEEQAMPGLEQLIIQRCKLLQNVPLGIEHLTQLKVVEFLDVHDELVRKLKRDEASEDCKEVAHIPELRYGFCRDGCWDVETVKRSGGEECSSSQETFTSGELPRCWK